MKPIYIFIILKLIVSYGLTAQNFQIASMNDDFTIKVQNVSPPEIATENKSVFTQMTGFPVAVTGNASFKNMRNVCLADINGDEIQDIIFAADNKIFVYTYQGLLWQKPLTGTGIYPPSVADINNDGFPEIVQLTGGYPASGRIFVFDKDGNTLPGWPVNLSDHWMICAPALADVDNDSIMEIIACERYSSTIGKVHIFSINGTSFSTNWPVTLDGVPAVTPSVGDVDNDGAKDIVAYSTKSKYIFSLDGQPLSGFPLTTEPNQKYSYQSPIIADFNEDNQYEITGSTHGDLPEFYVMANNGLPYNGWPESVPGNSWTYSPPTVVKINGEWKIFMSRPIGSTAEDMLYGWDANGNMLSGFPIVKEGGLEGYISVADINDNGSFELIFGANMLDTNGCGFIYAYNSDDGSPVAGFPIQPRGWTFMNGVCIGDINGDAQMDLVALSYTNSFGANTDTVYINVYEMNSAYNNENVLWETYKGSNDRSGYISMNSTYVNSSCSNDIIVSPNPCNDRIKVYIPSELSHNSYQIEIFDIVGNKLYTDKTCEQTASINLSHLSPGLYTLKITSSNSKIVKKIVLQR